MSEKTSVLVKKTPARTGRPASGNSSAYFIEVNLKPDFNDVAGEAALHILHNAGVFTARDVRIGRLYELKGNLNLNHVQIAARELLCDCVTHEFKVYNPLAPASVNPSKWRIEAWLHSHLTDPISENLGRALSDIGMPQATAIRCGLVYHVFGKCGRNHLEKAATRCLLNPVVHKITVAEAHS